MPFDTVSILAERPDIKNVLLYQQHVFNSVRDVSF
jgi:hypothetical protein